PLAFRCDISRPQWQRDLLDGVMNVNVVANVHAFRRRILDRKTRFSQTVYHYGSSNAITASNAQPAGWCIDAWSLGIDGVLPWQTIGSARSWEQGDSQALFYPSPIGPVPSVRLKAYRTGQQDVERL